MIKPSQLLPDSVAPICAPFMKTVISLRDLHLCFEGAVPAVIATAAADGTPNITYLSRVRAVDDERIALSNQFFSKTARNLAENPRASVLVIDPLSYDEFRLTLVYERTERRGVIFDQLRADVEAVAAVSGMQDVFKLRAADIYRVSQIDHMLEASRTEHAPATRAALLFSCNGRGTRLFSEPHHDARTIRRMLGSIPLAGFFAQGELGPVGGKNYIHGFTASVALFEEEA